MEKNLKTAEDKVLYLSHNMGLIATTSVWTEPEIMMSFFIAGDLQNIQKESINGHDILTYTLPRGSLTQLIGRRLSTKEGDKYFDKLQERKIKFKNEKTGMYTSTVLYPTIKWDENLEVVKFSINPEGYSILSQFDKYMPLLMDHLHTLKRSHNLRLYMLIKKDIYSLDRYKNSVEYPIEELRSHFGCPLTIIKKNGDKVDDLENYTDKEIQHKIKNDGWINKTKYPRHSSFIEHVIKKSTDEINKLCQEDSLDIVIRYEVLYKNKKIKSVKFTAKKTKNYKDYLLPYELSSLSLTNEYEDISSEIKNYSEELEIPMESLMKSIKNKGFTAVEMALRNINDRIKYPLNKDDKIENTHKYFNGLLKNHAIYNEDDSKYRILVHKIEELKLFCSDNNKEIIILLKEYTYFENIIFSYIYIECFNTLKKKIQEISNLSHDIRERYEIEKSKETIVESSKGNYTMQHLLTLVGNAEIHTSSIGGAIEALKVMKEHVSLSEPRIIEFVDFLIKEHKKSLINFQDINKLRYQ